MGKQRYGFQGPKHKERPRKDWVLATAARVQEYLIFNEARSLVRQACRWLGGRPGPGGECAIANASRGCPRRVHQVSGLELTVGGSGAKLPNF